MVGYSTFLVESFFLDPINVRFGAQVNGFFIESRRGHTAVVELIGRNDFQFWAGFNDEGFSFLVSEVEVLVSINSGS